MSEKDFDSENQSNSNQLSTNNNNKTTNSAVIIQESGHGHMFQKKTFHKPTYCHNCTEMLWGLIGQGLFCEVCNFVCHEKCQKLIVSPCSSIASSFIKNPVSHCWSEVTHQKRKFCNVCRKRLDDNLGLRCEICEYFAHVECQDLAINDCCEPATYLPNKDLHSIVCYHHWREGNLPSNSKCAACKKTCWTSECLAGMRCEWCGITTHSVCRTKVTEECNFGILKDIIIPPYAVSVPRMLINKEIILGIQPKAKGKNIQSEWSSSGDVKSELESQSTVISSASKNKRDKDKEDEDIKETIKVFDGDASYRKQTFRTISISRNSNYQQIIETSLRTFRINDDPFNYYISIPVNEEGNNETIVDEKSPIKHIKSVNEVGRIPSILLRYKDEKLQNSKIKIYSAIPKICVDFEEIVMDNKTDVKKIIKLVLEKFKLDPKAWDRYLLVEVLLDHEINERVLELNECPLEIIKYQRKKSISSHRMLRFYLQEKEDPNCASVSLYVGNLPTGLSQVQYEKLLMDSLKNENDLRWNRFDVIYYEYGSMVLFYNDSEKAVKAFKILKEAVFDEKQLVVLLLPTIQPPMIPSNVCPLLVFVNVKSGGQQGADLITSFRHLLNPHQVFDLQNGGPLPGLYVFRNIESYRILACGGDGTIGWILSCLDNVSQDAKCQSPPMAIVPLGTGNDLARVLRWGAGYTGAEEPINLLRDVIDAEEITLDRWTVVFHSDENKESDDAKRQISNNINQANTNEDNTEIYVMNNYLGIGIDADLCLDFHTAREENPNKFNSRLHNKKYYLQIGLRKIMNKGSCKDFNRHVSLEVDGRKVELPQIEGIIILNILSWGSGANAWGPEKDDQFQKPTHYDGMLEIVGIKGVVHMGQIQSGMTGAIRLAQGGRIKIRLNTDIPVQVDGEPWLQSPCDITILKSALKATMLKKSKSKIKRRNTEPSVYNLNTNVETSTVDQDGDSEPF